MQEQNLSAITNNYAKPKIRSETICLAFLYHQHEFWIKRDQSYSDYFTDERQTFYLALDCCVEKVNDREIKVYIGKQDDVDGEAFVEYLEEIKGYAKTLQTESFAFNLEAIKKQYLRRNLADMSIQILTSSSEEEDPEKLYEFARSKIFKSVEKSIPRSDFFQDLEKRYHYLVETKVKKTFPTGIPELDKDLDGGFSYADFVTLVGPTGSGKSFFLTQLAHECSKAGGNVAYFQSEMTLELSDMRLDSRVASMPFNKFKNRSMSQSEYDDWIVKIQNASKGGRIISFYMEKRNFTIANVKQVLEVLRTEGVVVDLILLDYILLMSVPQGSKKPKHERLEELADDLKNLANSYDRGEEKGVAVVTVTQGKPNLNKLGKDATLEEAIAYSASIGHASTHVYVLTSDDDIDEKIGKKVLKCMKARTMPTAGDYVIMQDLEVSKFHNPKRVAY